MVRAHATRVSVPDRRIVPRGDVRLGQAWSLGQKVENELLFSLISVALLAVRPLPHQVLLGIGLALGRIAHVMCGDARRIALDNVARVYPRMNATERAGLVRRCFETLGTLLGDSVSLLRPRRDCPSLPVSAHAQSLFRHARKDQRAVIFVSAHLGPWSA